MIDGLESTTELANLAKRTSTKRKKGTAGL